jgi:hypothetical protein
MRMILIAGIAATGIGLAATSGASAAPVNGAVIGDVATAPDHVTPVQWGGHWRWGSRGGHWRWGSSGYGGGGHCLWLRRSLALGQPRMAAVVSCPVEGDNIGDGPDPPRRSVR